MGVELHGARRSTRRWLPSLTAPVPIGKTESTDNYRAEAS